jgi:hypothetical protein
MNPLPLACAFALLALSADAQDSIGVDHKSLRTTSADSTRLLHKQIIEVTSPVEGNHATPLIDVRRYKTVRVAMSRGQCSGCSQEVRANVYAFTASDEPPITAQIDSFLIDQTGSRSPVFTFASRTYDVPGERLYLTFTTSSGSQDQVILLVFGRAN